MLASLALCLAVAEVAGAATSPARDPGPPLVARGASVGSAGDRGMGHATLAAVPYMGWNSYYGVGGVFDEKTIISVASSLIDRGLANAGYRIVWLDFGWASGKRGASAIPVGEVNAVVG